MSKLRVWWVPQVGVSQAFYVPVSTPEEGKKVMDMLAAYDGFQLQNRIKPDYVNTGGLQMWNEEEQEWCDWYIETDDYYFDEFADEFYCIECARKYKKLLDFGADGSQRLCSNFLRMV